MTCLFSFGPEKAYRIFFQYLLFWNCTWCPWCGLVFLLYFGHSQGSFYSGSVCPLLLGSFLEVFHWFSSPTYLYSLCIIVICMLNLLDWSSSYLTSIFHHLFLFTLFSGWFHSFSFSPLYWCFYFCHHVFNFRLLVTLLMFLFK